MNIDQFKNGDIIPEVKSEDDWKEAGENGQPAWCYYENAPENGEKFYNWYAVNDPRGLAPKGFHIPSHEEYRQLKIFLGDGNGAILKSKEAWKEKEDSGACLGFRW